MKTLLTGFGPFGNVADNPSARIIERFTQTGAEGHELTTRVLPVSYRRAQEEIGALLSEGRFDLALLLGVAAGSDKIRLEILGRNRSSDRKRDGDDEVTAGEVHDGGARILPATLTVRGIVGRLEAEEVPARISRTAGDYVCNHTYYAALRTIREQRLRTKCLFIHVPCDELAQPGGSGPIMEFEKQVRAVEIILAHAAVSANRKRA